MKILLTHPFCWPYVRRGAERFMAELSHYLSGRGHNVTILSSKPGPPDTVWHGGVTIVRKTAIEHRALSLIGVVPETTFALTCYSFLREQRFDVVHCLYYSDGFAAALALKQIQTPYIQHMTGIPTDRIPRRRPLDYPIQRFALSRAARAVVVSRAAAQGLRRLSHVEPHVIPVPCDLRTFRPRRSDRDLGRPRILAVGAFSQPRKGASILVKAFELVKQTYPGALLELSGDTPEPLRRSLLDRVSPAVRPDINFLGVGALNDLPELYGRAAVTVLPSIGESYGMTLVESLACGTPVVGSDDGGVPEIITHDVGTLFDPGSRRREPTNVQGLADAIVRALKLYRNPDIHDVCTDSVRLLGWDALGPRYEDLYNTVRHADRNVA